MRRSIRFQLRSARPNFTALAGIVGAIIALNILTGGQGFFAAYYTGMPMILIIFSLIDGCNISMTQLRVALSMGENRRLYFWSTQVVAVLYACAMGLLCLLTQKLPALLNLSWETVSFTGQIPWWLMALACFSLVLLGAATGLAMRRSKRLGVIVLLAVMFLSGIFLGLLAIATATRRWGDLSHILICALVASTGVLEVIAWRGFAKAVVEGVGC